MDTLQGFVTDINGFSLEDGPGIRTVVFFKGCPLHCLWCHNPESQRFAPQTSRLLSKCLHCGQCAAACPQQVRTCDGSMAHVDRCDGCGSCVAACPVQALSVLGKPMTAQQIVVAAARDKIFYEHSGGGVTLSGGEPMAQPDLVMEVLRSLRALGIHTAVETSGYFPPQWVLPLAGAADLILFDYKETDPSLHQRWTGVPLDPILRNLHALRRTEAALILRCPIIPGYNDRPDHFQGIARVAREASVQQVELMPYHRIGLEKACQIDVPQQSDIPLPTPEDQQHWADCIRAAGYAKVLVRGSASI